MTSSTAQLFVLSVHFRQPAWLLAQRAYLDLHVDVNHQRLLCVDGVPKSLQGKKEEWFEHAGSHARSLDLLAQIALGRAKPGDWLLILDSDALLLQPISGLLNHDPTLKSVQRMENLGDKQPHPSFFLCTVETYRALDASWEPGYMWKDTLGRSRTDVGAGFLEALERKGIPWQPLLRLNSLNIHPLLFGVYGNDQFGPTVYHHGAGSRKALGRIDHTQRRKKPFRYFAARLLSRARIVFLARYKKIGISPVIGLRTAYLAAFGKAIGRVVLENPDFWRVFTTARL